MKKIPTLLALGLALVAAGPGPSEARVNALEPWYPGFDTYIGETNTYAIDASLLSGEQFFEVPLQFTYVALPRLQAGGRWGFRYQGGKAGINDLQLGIKYQFLDGKPERPAIVGEAACSLPTAAYSDGLGTGAVGFIFNWVITKEIENMTGSFSLGMRLNSANDDHVQLGNVFSFSAGVQYPYSSSLILHGQLKGFNHSRTVVAGTEVPGTDFQELYLAPGADYLLRGGRTITGALLIGLTPRSHDLGLLISTKL